MQQTLGIWKGDYFSDRLPEISAAIRKQPTDSTIAAFAEYGDDVPAFTGRPVFVALELSVPYKRDYYTLISERVALQDRLFWGPVDAEWRAVLDSTGIDYFLDGPETEAGWNRMQRSFETLGDWPGSTVFTAHPAAAATCRVASSEGLDLFDAACFAAHMVEDSPSPGE
jgi:hypothetical protein